MTAVNYYISAQLSMKIVWFFSLSLNKVDDYTPSMPLFGPGRGGSEKRTFTSKCGRSVIDMDYVARAKEVINTEIEGLIGVRDEIGDGFVASIGLILDALSEGGKIVVTGVGKNLHIADKISATLASTGTTSLPLNPAQAMHGDLGVLCDGDVLIMLSYSGESDEILALLPLVKRTGIKTIAVTGSADSSLANAADVVIPATVGREACPFNMAPTSSTTATLAIGDALAMVLLDARGFKREDYAKLHPGGAIGKALLLHVDDIMRKEDRVAMVQTGSLVKDALLAMTEARAGSAAVTDESGRLAGIFTDGDLRRRLPDSSDLLEQSIDSVMSKDPITVLPTDLALEVLKIYEDHQIDDLLVVDSENRVVGAIDIQDLPKLKIM